MKKQVFNPYLPISEYIPDGEPHIFGDRVYIFGSHDEEGGYTFCMRDYVTYSAPVEDLSDWRYEGVIYKASQDPQYPDLKYMYAPDVVCGNDGKYYLYYSMGGDYGYGGYVGPISVAVADNPAGPYEFLDFVKNEDGTPLNKYILFDPAVINDDGVIRLYYGTQYGIDGSPEVQQEEEFENSLLEMFKRSREEIRSYPDNIMGAITTVLCDDMVTVKEEPKHIIPYHVKGTDFETHFFFEGPSMRKVGKKYYFIYSSWLNHELCYATSDYPDRDFVYGGTIVSNGDVGFEGRSFAGKLNMTGTTHGSIIEINGQWYVFYHRLTHKSDYSRQSCAEKITIDEDGKISQVQVTSCGLNDGPLRAFGSYPAVIACNITNGKMPHGSNSVYAEEFPNVTNKGEERFIGEIEHGTLIGYKYFKLPETFKLEVTVRPDEGENHVTFDGPLRVDIRCTENTERIRYTKEEMSDESFLEIRISENGESVGTINLNELGEEWETRRGVCNVAPGIYPLYLVYHGKKKIQLKEIAFL